MRPWRDTNVLAYIHSATELVHRCSQLTVLGMLFSVPVFGFALPDFPDAPVIGVSSYRRPRCCRVS